MGPLWRKISEPLRGGSFGYFYSGLHGHTCRGHRGHYDRGVLGHHTRGQDSHWSGRHKGHSVQPFRQRPGLPGRRLLVHRHQCQCQTIAFCRHSSAGRAAVLETGPLPLQDHKSGIVCRPISYGQFRRLLKKFLF